MNHILIENPAETKIFSLGPRDFSSLFGETVSPVLSKRIGEHDFRYLNLTSAERDQCLLFVIDLLLDSRVGKSGEHRQSEWERGWSENLELVRKGDPKD